MNARRLFDRQVAPIGFGCMNVSHAYGAPAAPEQARALLLRALDLGVDHFDTAALYGFGANETLVGDVLSPHRQKFFLASKCGMHGVDGKRVIDGRPETLRATCEGALKRLKTDVIDLYYLHRLDPKVPIEESVGGLGRLVEAGKIRSIGLSEISANTLRRAHQEHPIAAVQSEYSLWTRNPEIAMLKACDELGVTFVAFSPVGRGFLADTPIQPESLDAKDIRKTMPRFEREHFQRNLEWLGQVKTIARAEGCSVAQLALAWLLHRHPGLLVIPGTTQIAHLEENVAARAISLSEATIKKLSELMAPDRISGNRYNAPTQLEIDTEQFDCER